MNRLIVLLLVALTTAVSARADTSTFFGRTVPITAPCSQAARRRRNRGMVPRCSSPWTGNRTGTDQF